ENAGAETAVAVGRAEDAAGQAGVSCPASQGHVRSEEGEQEEGLSGRTLQEQQSGSVVPVGETRMGQTWQVEESGRSGGGSGGPADLGERTGSAGEIPG